MENINRYIKEKTKEIIESSYDFKGLFEVIHNQDENVFAEYIKNYQVKRVSYKEMRSYCLKTASYLKDKIEVGEDKFVGLYMENSVNFLSCMWGILAAGFNPVLLNCKLPKEINQNIVKTMRIKTIVTSENNIPEADNVVHIEKTNDFIPEIKTMAEINTAVWGDKIALSSTATSTNYKICVYTGENLTYQVLNAKGVLAKNKNVKKFYKGYLKQLCFLPFYHIFGLVATYFWFSIYGRVFVFLNDYSSDTILKTVQRTNVTHLFAVPLLWNTLAREVKKEIDNMPEKDRKKAYKAMELSLKLQNIFPNLGMKVARKIFEKVVNRTLGDSIKFLITGGGYVSDETLKIINAVGYPLYNGYGSTEIGITSVELRTRPKYRMEGSVGKPFDSLKYSIQDGILCVSGKSTCSKIIDKNGNVTDLSNGEIYKTNDNAAVDKTGSYYILGRNDDVFVGANGEKINPDIIEKKCMLTSVQNYCILSYEGKLTLIFEFQKTSNDFLVKKVSTEITNTLKNLKNEGLIISKVYFTNDPMINLNAIKVSRTILLKKIYEGSVKLRPFEDFAAFANKSRDEIMNDTILKIKAIFADVLNKEVNEIDVDKHFIFDLGGTSIDYCTLLLRLKEEFSIDFKFENQSFSTVREFWNYIDKKENGEKTK